MKQQGNVRQLIHTPAEAAYNYLAWAESIQANPGIPFGVPALDAKMIPLRPGNLVGIIGRPGNGKSSLLCYLARQEAKRIMARGAEATEAVVYVTYESAVEELENFFQLDDGDECQYSASDVAWGRVDLDVLRKRTAKRVRLPVWLIGHGVYPSEKNVLKPPRMYTETVLKTIAAMHEDFGVKPVLVLFDYLQLVPVEQAADRMQQVTEAPILLKEFALRARVPVVTGIQARREVDQRQAKIPEMNDCQWGSSIEQAMDKLFSIWRPCTTEDEGTLIELMNKRYAVTDTLAVVRMLKQRGDQGRYTWIMYFAPQYLRLAEMEFNP